MYIKRDPPGKGRMTFRKRRRFPIVPMLLYLGVLGLAWLAFSNRERIQPQIVQAIGPTPTATQSIPELTAQADELFLDGEFLEAAALYEQAANIDPNNLDLWFMVGHLKTLNFSQSRNITVLEEAQAIGENMIEMNPEDPRGYAVQSRALNWQGNYAEAANAASRAVEIDPDFALGHAYLAEAYTDLGRFRQALSEAELAIRLDPYNVEARRNYAWVLANYGRYSEAIIQYEQALRLQPNRVDLLYELALNYRWSGRPDDAVETFEEIILRVPESDRVTFRVEIGKTYFEVRDDGAAQEYLSAAVDDICPECPLTRGVWEMDDMDYMVWKLEPELPENIFMPAWTRLGMVYFTRRNYEDAVDIFEEALAYAEAHSEEVQAPMEAYYVTASAYYYLNECQRAVPLAETALERWQATVRPDEPGDTAVLNSILSVFVLCRDYSASPYVSNDPTFVNGFPPEYPEPNVIVQGPGGDVQEPGDAATDDEMDDSSSETTP